MLLTDGTVMCQAGTNWYSWLRLTPDSHGSYAHGTWSWLADSHIGRLYGPSAVLRDGRVFEAGGEYLSNSVTDHNTMEVYDPVSNTWTNGPDGLFGDIGDTGSKELTDGRMLVATRVNTGTQIWNPATNAWTQTANKSTNTSGDEESWQMLPDGTVFDAEDNPGERYQPTTGKWIPVAPCPVTLKNTANWEIGAFVMLYTGNVFCLGGSPGHTALYTPPTTLSGLGAWLPSPDQPNGTFSDDTPACIEPNGNVLCVTSPATYGTAVFSEYDPVANSFTTIPGPTTYSRSDIVRLLALPNGQILQTFGGSNIPYVYTPVGAPQDAWRPTISSITRNNDGSYHLIGTQLNGLSEGGSYGDDANMSSNYPLVRLTDSAGVVRYCRTFNHSTMGLATGSTPVSTEFTLPTGLSAGTYTLVVAANGIASAPVSFSLTPILTSIIVSPTAPSVADGQTQQFTAAAYDQFGTLLASQPAFTWSLDTTAVGTVSGTGSYTAPATGTGFDTVRATSGSISGAATVTFGAATVANGSFETPNVGTASYIVRPTGAVWTFANGSGIQSNGSAWAAANAPDGVQTAFLQRTGAASQSVSFPGVGTYQINFMAARRIGQVQPVQVSIDGAAIGSAITPASNTFQPYSSAPFAISTPGAHTITIAGTNSSADLSTLIDQVSTGLQLSIAKAAVAAPNPVTGTTTDLSVLGASAGGESTLIYTWAATGMPPAPVTFSANGSNSAKNAVATFTKPGSYTLQVTITDSNNAAVTNSVTVNVIATASTIALSPTSATLINDQTQQFTAAAYDQFGTLLASQPAFTWSLDTTAVGTVSGTGSYTAPATGTGFDTVRATSGSISGAASITFGSATVVNGSFETPNVGTANYKYLPSGAAWAFTGSGGIQNNGSAWGAASAPDGVQTAFLQGTGAAAQSVSFAKAGTYQLDFKAARRGTIAQAIQISVDGTAIGSTITPASNTFQPYSSAPFAISTPGAHTIMLAGTRNIDQTSFVDQVSLTLTAVQVPPSTVSGTALLQAWTGTPQPLTFVLTPTGTTQGAPLTQTLTPSASGAFSLPNVPAGTYTLGVKGTKWLRKDIPIDTTAGNVTNIALTLPTGDINNDNRVSAQDYALLQAAYGSIPTSTNWNPSADLNGDNRVSAQDYALLRGNYGTAGDL